MRVSPRAGSQRIAVFYALAEGFRVLFWHHFPVRQCSRTVEKPKEIWDKLLRNVREHPRMFVKNRPLLGASEGEYAPDCPNSANVGAPRWR